MFVTKMEKDKNTETNTYTEKKHSNHIEKKITSIIHTYEEPLLPKLCRNIFWCMIIITTCMLLVDINSFFQYDNYMGAFHLFYNLSTTGFIDWTLFSILQICLSFAAIRQSKKQYWKKIGNPVITDPSAEVEMIRLRTKRALKRLTIPFVRYIKICLAGVLLWATLFLIFHL